MGPGPAWARARRGGPSRQARVVPVAPRGPRRQDPPHGRKPMSSGLDHGELIHFAGRHGLSPALQDGAPALVAHGEPGARCGWAALFSALAARGETLALSPDGGWRRLPLGEAPSPSRPSAPGAFLHRATATLRALRGLAP